jgi:hypothetical protein
LLDKIQKTAYILVIILFRSKNLKTQKTNGVPRHKQNYTIKYYRFSRRRKKSLYSLYYDFKYRKKSVYMTDIGRSKMLDSGFFENQAWGGLHKAWKGYTIAKNK